MAEQGRRVAVVGAGPAGLAAAWALQARGLEVTVFERSGRAGGLLRTETIDGARVDVGVQLVGSPHRALFELAERAGAGTLLRRSRGHDALWRNGRPHGITYGSVTSMVASGALPTTLKLRLASRYIPFLKSQARDLDVSDPAGSGAAAFDDESIGAWGLRQLGDEFVELLAYPLLAAYYGALPEETSAGVYHALALVGMDVSVYGAVGGFGALADAIVSALEERGVRIERGVEVQTVEPGEASVAPDGAGAQGGAGAQNGAGARGGVGVRVDGRAFDGVVLAVPANRAAALLREAGAAFDAAGGGELRAWLGQVHERSTFTFACRLDRAFPGTYFGLSFPRTSLHGRRIAAACIQSRKLEGLVPDGSDALVVLPAPSAVPELLAETDERIATLLTAELEAAVHGITRHITSTHVYRLDDAYSVFPPGHVRRLAALRGRQPAPRVALAGDYLMAPSVEGAIRSGLEAGSRIAADLVG